MVSKHNDTNLQSRILMYWFSKGTVVILATWLPRNKAIFQLLLAKDFRRLEEVLSLRSRGTRRGTLVMKSNKSQETWIDPRKSLNFGVGLRTLPPERTPHCSWPVPRACQQYTLVHLLYIFDVLVSATYKLFWSGYSSLRYKPYVTLEKFQPRLSLCLSLAEQW